MFTGIKAYIGAALVLLVFAAGWTVNGWRLSRKVERLEVDLTTAKAANVQLSGLVAEQNAAYDKLVKDGDELKARLSEAERRAQQVRVEWRERIRVVMQDAPPADATCEEAVLWARVQYAALLSSWL